jgi:hypothetical protein
MQIARKPSRSTVSSARKGSRSGSGKLPFGGAEGGGGGGGDGSGGDGSGGGGGTGSCSGESTASTRCSEAVPRLKRHSTVTARRIALMATSWARVPQRAQRHDRSALEKAVGLRIWSKVFAKNRARALEFLHGNQQRGRLDSVTPNSHSHSQRRRTPSRLVLSAAGQFHCIGCRPSG